MLNFCTNCGHKLEEESNFCTSCGFQVKNKVKKTGKGFSIASMVLGICSMLVLFSELSVTIYDLNLELAPYFNEPTYIKSLIDYMFFDFLISTVGLVLGLIAFFKSKNGFNISGVCLNVLALLGFVCVFAYYISFY